MKNYTEYITESIKSIEYVYDKFYSNLDKDVFDKILNADPTTVLKDNKIGIYVKWLIKIYQNKQLKLEDLYKATEYLSVFHRFKHKMVNKNILSYTSLPELFKAVEPYLEREEFVFENDTERKLAGQFKEVFRGDKYRIIIPLTLKASKYFGRETEWCTVNTNEFETYTEDQDANVISYKNLYILYTEDLDERYQFHFNDMQFMDVYDSPIENLDNFFNDNLDIKNFFGKQDWFRYIGFAPNDYIELFLSENGFGTDGIKMISSEYHDGFQISIEEIFAVYSDKIIFDDIRKYLRDKPTGRFGIDIISDDDDWEEMEFDDDEELFEQVNKSDVLYHFKIEFFR